MKATSVYRKTHTTAGRVGDEPADLTAAERPGPRGCAGSGAAVLVHLGW